MAAGLTSRSSAQRAPLNVQGVFQLAQHLLVGAGQVGCVEPAVVMRTLPTSPGAPARPPADSAEVSRRAASPKSSTEIVGIRKHIEQIEVSEQVESTVVVCEAVTT